MRYRFRPILTTLIVLFTGCIQPKYGINAYNEQNNTTNYYLISYGGLVIPGKWNRDARENDAGMYSLIGPDSTNRLFVSVGKPRRSFLGFSPYTESYNYLNSELALSENQLRENDFLVGDTANTFDIIERDSVNNFIISKRVTKRGRLRNQDITLNGIKKKKLMHFSLVTYTIDSITNPKIWDVTTQKDLLKKVFMMN